MFGSEKINIKSLYEVLHKSYGSDPDKKMRISIVEHGHTKITHHELHYRISGECKTYFDGKVINSKAGSLYYFPQKPNVEYYSKSSGSEINTEKIIIFFETDSPMPQKPILWDISQNPDVKRLILKIYENWKGRNGPAANYHLCMSLLYQLIYEISVLPENQKNTRLTPAIEFIDMNFSDPNLDVESLGKKCCLSHSHFKRLFIEQFGMPPKTYIQKKRMEYARKLLTEENTNVSDAAKLSGFSSQSYFSRAYKNYYGTAPKQHRKNSDLTFR